jgi:tyrosine-protein phosphatase SIW14
MPTYVRWSLGVAIAALVILVPAVHFRAVYTHGKRLREVTPGKFYRSGEMTAAGFREAIALYGFRTIVNLQDEYPDPELAENYFGGGTVKESKLCRQLGIRYVYLPPDLIPRRQVPARRPEAIDKLLALLDDPDSYPVLIHCRAGLHRTGVMTAVYRMEYEGWTPGQAIEDLKANGFGEWPCTAANDYITQYILTYKRGLRHKQSVVRSQ